MKGRISEERQQWFLFSRQLHNAEAQPAEPEQPQTLVGVGYGV